MRSCLTDFRKKGRENCQKNMKKDIQKSSMACLIYSALFIIFSNSMLGVDGDAAESTAGDSSGPSLVKTFHSSVRWQLYFSSVKQVNKLVVVDFSANWCGPCQWMEKFFNGMPAKYTDVDFVKLEVDELSDVAREYAVQAMPTFVLLKQGKEVERIVGAKKAELETKIRKHRKAPKFAA